MTELITNPTPDQLKGGGVIKEGTYRGIKLRDEPLHATGYKLELAIGDGNMLVRCENGEYYLAADPVIAVYEPPESKPWDNYDGWLMYELDSARGKQKACVRAHQFRSQWVTDNGELTSVFVSNVRRVALIDGDYLTVPRWAIQNLRYGIDVAVEHRSSEDKLRELETYLNEFMEVVGELEQL